MPRKSKSQLPESFEEFSKQMQQSPSDMSTPDVRPIGGMEETVWAGVAMWRCPRCRDTAWSATEANLHTCKQPKTADETDD